MSLRRPRRLGVETLEGRITPAVSIRYYSGLLAIQSDNLPNNLKVAETAAPGKFTITNNGKFAGTYAFSNLMITMGNSNDNVELQIKTALTGRLIVSLGNGGDTFNITNTGALPTSRIGGDVLVNFGRATVRGPLIYDQEFNTQGVTIGGNMTVIGSVGAGTELVNLDAGRLGGSLSVVNVFQTSLGTNTIPTDAFRVGGNVSVSNVQKNTDTRTISPPLVGGNGLNLFSLSAVSGSIYYVGGGGADRVYLPQDPINLLPVSVGGNVSVNLGGGINTLALGNGTVGATVGGNVNYTGGADVDRFFLDSGSVVAGSVYLNLGEGNNQVFGDSTLEEFGPFDPAGVGSVFGDVTIVMGNGDNYIGTFGPGSSFNVAGNLTFILGNGNNFGGPAFVPTPMITFFNNNVSVSGLTTYRAGTGMNFLDITSQLLGPMRLQFSGGDTTVLFNQASGVFTGGLYLDFGTGFGPKTLGGTAAFTEPVTILNY